MQSCCTNTCGTYCSLAYSQARLLDTAAQDMISRNTQHNCRAIAVAVLYATWQPRHTQLTHHCMFNCLKIVAKQLAQAAVAAAVADNQHKHFSDARFEGLKHAMWSVVFDCLRQIAPSTLVCLCAKARIKRSAAVVKDRCIETTFKCEAMYSLYTRLHQIQAGSILARYCYSVVANCCTRMELLTCSNEIQAMQQRRPATAMYFSEVYIYIYASAITQTVLRATTNA
eukprot:15864-Heterococcus_DN1.PRE.2